jgi:hypothetical protein
MAFKTKEIQVSQTTRIAALVGAIAVAMIWVSAPAEADSYLAGRGAVGCNEHTIKGTYAVQMQGTRPVPGGGTIESVIGLLLVTYDGFGNFSSIANIKGAGTGIVPNRPGTGVYTVNVDCTGTMKSQPVPGLLVEEALVIIDRGREIRSITVSPQLLMVTAVGQRIAR